MVPQNRVLHRGIGQMHYNGRDLQGALSTPYTLTSLVVLRCNLTGLTFRDDSTTKQRTPFYSQTRNGPRPSLQFLVARIVMQVREIRAE